MMMVAAEPQQDPTARVSALIVERPLCLSCLVLESELPLTRVFAALAGIPLTTEIEVDPEGRCDGCGNIRTVISLPR
jgi:hypothetical protein